MTKAEEYAALQAQRAEITKQIGAIAKGAFTEQAQVLFEKNPTLVAFSWTQYTPYFNDGEPCTFGANTDDPKIQLEGEDDRTEAYFSTHLKRAATPREVIGMQVTKFLRAYDDADLEEMFEDHAEVIVSRTGVDIESYEHD